MIPIVLLHHNQPDVLLRSIEQIYTKTKIPYRLFIVDNSSKRDGPVQYALKIAIEKFEACVITNPKDNWIYGFNLAIQNEEWPDSEYYLFSDADIIVPDLGAKLCWLEYLVNQMTEHCCIGKLGLSLDLSNLESNPTLIRTLAVEKKYMQGPKIGTNIVAPVDTTMAIYRKDFFITEFKFQIGHASLSRPHYYTCRTSSLVTAVHVGWDFYPGAGVNANTIDQQWKKALAFCFMGAQVAPELMTQFSIFQRFFLKFMMSLIRSAHGAKVTLLMFVYLVKLFPRKLNTIQTKVR
jgi:hypothetical protein